MIECYSCGYEFEEDDNEVECPYCGRDDWGEGFYRCEECGALVTYSGDEWVCEYCQNEGITEEETQMDDDDDDCFMLFCDEDDEYCEDGIPDVNQGWVGEHYG